MLVHLPRGLLPARIGQARDEPGRENCSLLADDGTMRSYEGAMARQIGMLLCSAEGVVGGDKGDRGVGQRADES